MSYPITTALFNLFKSNSRQVARINVRGLSGQTTLSEGDILDGGLTIDRYSSSGEDIALGTAIAAEATLRLENNDRRFDDFLFEGAELYVQIGTKDWTDESASVNYIPFGYFTVDEANKQYGSLELKALDRMVLFDKPVDPQLLTFPMTLGTLLSRICDICNVVYNSASSSVDNMNYVVSAAPDFSNATYRDVLSWTAEAMGACAFFDWTGRLVLRWLNFSDFTITAQDRFSFDSDEKEIQITGLRVTNGVAEFVEGEAGYLLNIENNPLIQHDFNVIAEEIFYDSMDGFVFTPAEITTVPLPHIYPLDYIFYRDHAGISRPFYVTDVTFTMNRNTVISGKGQSARKRGYAAMNPLTAREQAIIRTMAEEQNAALNDRVQTTIAFNELLSNALGLFITPVTQNNKSVIYYLHDREALADSGTIFTMTDTGIAWTTTGWNDGNPVWSYGVTSAGDALFKMLSAEGIEVSKTGSDYNVEITPEAFRVYYRDMLVTNIEADEMEIPRVTVSTYLQCGKIRLVPFGDSGANIIFVD